MESGKNQVSIRIDNLSKSYGDLKALDRLSLDVFQGEILGLLGPNGAGKTTTINLVCGLIRADHGRVVIDEKLMNQPGRGRRSVMGLCPQELIIWESLTCLEQLEFIGCQYNVPRHIARDRAHHLLDILGLSHKKKKLARTLSGGMKRRLNLALALVHDPPVVILDEPQAGLDPQSRVLVREQIRSMAKKKTVILTTHEMDEADRLSDRVAIMDHGRLLELDTPENLKNRIGEGDVLEISIGSVPPEMISELKKKLSSAYRHIELGEGNLKIMGIRILEKLPAVIDDLKRYRIQPLDVVVRRKTLEDVFISLTGRSLRE